uniref:Uncharacterized protein n=1 Tax=Rhizophora mucronata TaxID=61149 RepID=A0A2P2LCT3_RHIMU
MYYGRNSKFSWSSILAVLDHNKTKLLLSAVECYYCVEYILEIKSNV